MIHYSEMVSKLKSVLEVELETRGAWVEFKKPILEKLPVLDPYTLSKRATSALAKKFNKLSREELLRFPAIDQDEARSAIDKAIGAAMLATAAGRADRDGSPVAEATATEQTEHCCGKGE